MDNYTFFTDGCNKLLREGKIGRQGIYKNRSVVCDQETRRLELLSNQKRSREKTFNDFRSAELFSNWDKDDLEGEQHQVMEWSNTEPKKPRLKDMFMLSEWMITLPEDFYTKWLFVLCPVGKRCLVRCTKGSTSVYGKSGQRLAKFQSALPNGGQRDISGYRYSNSEITILDCIWNSDSKSYFVLDMLSWKGQLYMNTEMSFRAFWIKSKLEELPNLSERSEKNTYPFIPLVYHPCDLSSISSTLSKHGYFSLDEPKVDGILFYHSEAYYIPGFTPLVLWLKPFMLPELLNMTIPEMYEEMRPSSYVDMEHFILEYEEKKVKKKKKHKNRGKESVQIEENIEGITPDVDMFEES